MTAKTRRELILDTVQDLSTDFLHYERKEDEELPQGEIEAAIKAGEISVDDIVGRFRESIEESL